MTDHLVQLMTLLVVQLMMQSLVQPMKLQKILTQLMTLQQKTQHLAQQMMLPKPRIPVQLMMLQSLMQLMTRQKHLVQPMTQRVVHRMIHHCEDLGWNCLLPHQPDHRHCW